MTEQKGAYAHGSLSGMRELIGSASEQKEQELKAEIESLRFQLLEAERELDEVREEANYCHSRLVEVEQERKALREANTAMREELEKVKTERDDLIQNIKDFHERTPFKYYKRKFKSIISQYTKGDTLHDPNTP